MRLLLDTDLLLWTAGVPDRRSDAVSALIEEAETEAFFSAASIWEIAIQYALRRDGLLANPHVLRRELLEHEYTEIPITGEHGAAVTQLPRIHKDPFDRILVAQAQVEGLTLLTADRTVARYPGPIRLV